jgi:dTDP-4-dehydrorhamnose reductase
MALQTKKILFTGGSGLLGREFKKNWPDILFPPSSQFDIENPEQMESYLKKHPVAVLIHAAAFTSPPKVEKDPGLALSANIIGTANVVRLAMKYGLKLVYISTDYVFKGDAGGYRENDPVLPINKYAWSKLGGECAVRLYDNHLIIRTSFGPRPFPYDRAFIDQWTSRESVQVVAKKIFLLVKKGCLGTVHVGGQRRTVYAYAKELSGKKKIGKLSRNEVSFSAPKDTSLNTEKFKKIIHKK